MENNSRYDFVLEERIFTDKQKEFMTTNYDNMLKFKHEKEVAEREITDDDERRRKVRFLMDQEDVARGNLEPFIQKTNEFTEKKNNIMKSNGLELNDFPNDKAMREINLLASNMKEESAKYSDDLKNNLEIKKDLESMFKTDSPKNDLDSMFEENKDENKSNLALQFK